MISVTEATLDDLDALTELLGLLFAHEPEFSADPDKQKAGLKLILNDPNVGRILVARSEHRIIGMVNLLFTISTALGNRVAILDDLVVRETERSNGVGKMLMDAAIEFCAARDLARISLQTDFDNDRAQHLYESRGFARSTMIPYRRLL